MFRVKSQEFLRGPGLERFWGFGEKGVGLREDFFLLPAKKLTAQHVGSVKGFRV